MGSLRWMVLGALVLNAGAGCGYGISAGGPTTLMAPVIEQQPSNQSVPMGLSAQYSVIANGESMKYQWSKNANDLPGATDSSYTTSPTTFADDGSTFVVTVSNAAGAIASVAASLMVTARAPAADDLRFQQVDSASTVNGYGNGDPESSTLLEGRTAEAFISSLGTPLWVGGKGTCTTAIAPNEPSCAWRFLTLPLPASPSGLGLIAGYASDVYSNVQYDLADPNWPNIGNGASPAASGSVVTSLDLEPAAQQFAVSWIQAPTDSQSSFSPVQNTVLPSGLQEAASREGANSRVITAVSAQNGNITYVSYSWSADTSTVYELMTSSSSAAAAPDAAVALAGQGYIITATGLADDAGNVLLVGTRVRGDTKPRPFISAKASNVPAMLREGYATVGVIVDSSQSDPYTYLGER